MFRQLAEDRFILYLLLCSVLGFTLGCLGGLLIYVILMWNHIAVFMYSMFEAGWG
jgi:hypothetical protein